MDIKLRARLSAYSKVDSMSELHSFVPGPEVDSVGNILGIGSSGQYTFMAQTSHADIDTLFESQGSNRVSKDKIDSLFDIPPSREDKVIDKDTIDTLFKDKPEVKPENTSRVSYAQIDSLFK